MARAIDDFTKAIELDETYADAYSHRATAYDATDEADKAKADRSKLKELKEKKAGPVAAD